MYVEVSKDYPLTYQINDYLMKQCTKCNEVKELTEFHKAKGCKDGRRGDCKSCHYLRSRKRVEANPEAHRAYQRKWEANNKERIRIQRRIRYNADPTFRLLKKTRRRIQRALNGESKSAATTELLGCTPEHARFHIESQFTEGMTWDNIHIDHIQPCASFDLEDPNEQRKCFHYTNLQPLLAEDNIRKSDSIVPEHQVSLL